MSNLNLWQNWFRNRDPEEGLLRVLAQVPVFADLRPEGLRQIREMMHIRNYADGEPVFYEGQPGTGMYVIISGTVRILLHYGQEDEIEIVRLGPGDFFGEFSLLDEAPRSATCVAVESTELGGFFRSDLMELIERQPRMGVDIVLRLAEVVAERLRHTNADLRLTKEELRSLKEKTQSKSGV